MGHRTQVCIRYDFYLYSAILLLMLPLRWVISVLLAALIHELWHIAAIGACGIQLYSVSIGAFGARLHTAPMTNRQELLCALAGPLGALTMLLFCRPLPVTAFCCIVQSVFNLLPLYPADGGRALRCFLLLLWSEDIVNRVMYIINIVLRIGIALLGIYGAILGGVGIIGIWIALVVSFGKFPCNRSKSTVQ